METTRYFHGNPNPIFQVGDILGPEHEGGGGYEDIYMTPDIGLARQYIDPETEEQAEQWGNGEVYELEPLDTPVLNTTDYPDDVFVYTCRRARVIQICY